MVERRKRMCRRRGRPLFEIRTFSILGGAVAKRALDELIESWKRRIDVREACVGVFVDYFGLKDGYTRSEFLTT